MNIYIASSWKNKRAAFNLADFLRFCGHRVDCFCDTSTGRYVFHWPELADVEEELANYDAISFLKDPRAQKAFKEDKYWIDWCECLVLLLPCGNSAHLEAGYAKGQGKKLIIYGDFPKGKFDVMYGFADVLCSTLQELEGALK